MTETLPRPRQVTMAAWMAIGASALVVLTVFETLAGLNTIETRRSVEIFLSEPPGDGLGLDVGGALEVLRVLAMVTAGCATAAIVLGWHVLKRNKGARLALTLLAVPLFFAGMVVGGFLSSVVAASALVLWLEPSRDWFNGVRARPREQSAPGAAHPQATPPVTGPRAHQGFGRAPAAPPKPGPWTPQGVPSERRPGAVLAACLITWILSGLTLVMMGLSVVVLAVAPDLVWDELLKQNPDLTEQGVTRAALGTATFVTAAVAAVWALAAIALAVLVYRRVGWARVALSISAVAAGVVCVLASIGALVMVVPAIACGTALSLLVRPDVRGWFERS